MRINKVVTDILIGALCMTAICSCTPVSQKKDRDEVYATEGSALSEPQVTSDLCELPEREAIIYVHYDNYSEGYQARDVLVMSDGRVYVSEEHFTSPTEENSEPLPPEDRLQMLMLSTLPTAQFDVDALTSAYSYMQHVGPDAEFIYDDEIVYDGGYSYTEVNAGGEWIKISEGGAYTGYLDDDYARAALQTIRDELSKLNLDAAAHIYSRDITFVKTYELGDADLTPCKMLITNMDELRAFDEMTGIGLEENECFEEFGDSNYDWFYSSCIAVEIIAYDEVFSIDTVEADAFIVSDDYVGFSSLASLKMATTDLRLGTDKYYCHVAVVPAYDMSVYDGFAE